LRGANGFCASPGVPLFRAKFGEFCADGAAEMSRISEPIAMRVAQYSVNLLSLSLGFAHGFQEARKNDERSGAACEQA